MLQNSVLSNNDEKIDFLVSEIEVILLNFKTLDCQYENIYIVESSLEHNE